MIKDDEDEFLKKALGQFKDDKRASAEWRQEARLMYDFRSGHQWSQEDLMYLEEQRRPPVVFNRAGTIIDAVCGNEISNRQEIRYFPRTLDDSQVNESATNAVKWVQDQCNAEDEESDMFEDALITGMGWTETRISYDEDLDGKIIIERVSPLEMYWDYNASKHNLEDAGHFFREKYMDREEVESLWPEAKTIVPDSDQEDNLDDPFNADPPHYERELIAGDKTKDQIRVLEYQWCEKTPFYRIHNPTTSEIESVDFDQFKVLKERFKQLGHDVNYVKQEKKLWYRAFIAGKTLLERGDAPVKESSGWKCVTGKRDAKKKGWYGLMRGMKDPQEWANKFFSQILHIINSNSKGGFFYETGAVKDPNTAKEDLSKPEGMIELNPGGLGRIKERQMFQFPASIDRMLEFAISSIRDVPGVNLELLGAANRDQPGVLEAQRQRQALAVLAPLFSNLRRYRKNHGRLLLNFIRDYIADGRLIRIITPDGDPKTVKMMKDTLVAEYDIIVDQSPNSTNAKTEAWIALSQVLPVLQQAQFPIPKEIVDILPLPESVISKWKESMKNGPQIPPEVKQQMEELQQQVQQLEQENQQLKSNQQVKMMEVQGKQEIAHGQIQSQIQLEQMKAMLQEHSQQIQASQEAQLKILLARIDAATKIEVAEISKQAQISSSQISAAKSATN